MTNTRSADTARSTIHQLVADDYRQDPVALGTDERIISRLCDATQEYGQACGGRVRAAVKALGTESIEVYRREWLSLASVS